MSLDLHLFLRSHAYYFIRAIFADRICKISIPLCTQLVVEMSLSSLSRNHKHRFRFAKWSIASTDVSTVQYHLESVCSFFNIWIWLIPPPPLSLRLPFLLLLLSYHLLTFPLSISLSSFLPFQLFLIVSLFCIILPSLYTHSDLIQISNLEITSSIDHSDFTVISYLFVMSVLGSFSDLIIAHSSSHLSLIRTLILPWSGIAFRRLLVPIQHYSSNVSIACQHWPYDCRPHVLSPLHLTPPSSSSFNHGHASARF